MTWFVKQTRDIYLSKMFPLRSYKKQNIMTMFGLWLKYKLWSRCLDEWQFFPPGRPIWCNNSTKGPTARPAAKIGGHLCCGDENYCNSHLKPIIYDFSKYPHKIFEGGDHLFEYYYWVRVLFNFFFFCVVIFHSLLII